MIEKELSQRAWQIAHRWAAGAPGKVKGMEADGTLLERLREQAELEAQTIADARVGGAMSDVPDSEVLALYDIPLLPDEGESTPHSDDSKTVLRTYSVLVMDMFHYMDPDEEITISGFPTLDAAREYARRRTRDSLEELCPETGSANELRELWFAYGEDCIVMNGNYAGGNELAYFIDHPAIEAERDWKSLTP
jgi:hypothetical protein